jgi:hypothetical protein
MHPSQARRAVPKIAPANATPVPAIPATAPVPHANQPKLNKISARAKGNQKAILPIAKQRHAKDAHANS